MRCSCCNNPFLDDDPMPEGPGLKNAIQDLPEYRNAVFDLWCWQHSNHSSFTDQLFSLIHKADPDHQYKLYQGFRFHVEAMIEWKHTDSQEEFFAKYGFLDRSTA